MSLRTEWSDAERYEPAQFIVSYHAHSLILVLDSNEISAGQMNITFSAYNLQHGRWWTVMTYAVSHQDLAHLATRC